MSDPSKSKLANWVPVLITFVGWVFMGGMGFQRLGDHEKRMDKIETVQAADHDGITTMRQQVNDLHEWMKAWRKP